MLPRTHKEYYGIAVIALTVFSLIPSHTFCDTSIAGAQTLAEISVLDLNRQIQEKKSKIAAIRGRIASYETTIKKKRSEKVTLESQISIIDDGISSTQLELEATQDEIDQLTLEIEQASGEIKDKVGRIDGGKKQISSIIRSLYEESQRSDLEILLMNDRFSDFFDMIHSLDMIQSNLKNSVQQVKDLHEQLLAQKASMEHGKLRQESLKEKLLNDQATMEDQKNAKKSLVMQSVLSAEKYHSLLKNARNEQEQADADITSLEKTVREKMKLYGDAKAQLAWPISPLRGITTYFHDAGYPFRHIFEHPGIDVRASQGSYINSPEDGYVARVKFDGSKAYSYIMIVHAGGIATVFGHVSRPLVAQDTYVKKGQVIGLSGALPGSVGAGPFTTGPHLHFEVRLNGIPVDPLKYLP